MHITQFTDYALRALIYLGTNDQRRVTIQEIAERFDVSRNHLMKVVNELIRNGYAEGVRGKGGGLRLARPAGEIVVGEVVRRMEPGMELVECFGSGCKCILDPECQLKFALSRALSAFLAVLDELTLADMLGEQEEAVLRLAPVPVRRKTKRLAAAGG
ncbi:MAG: HTH-type transcriptional repressor NsrR [Pseudomonadales bacterium]|nr:HTH-type transcriptional repressor NsrR [Pseudomonadales bacterium]